MKKIAKREEDIAEVINNLTEEEKLQRVKKFYDVEEVLEILGYYNDSMDKDQAAALDDVEYDVKDMERIAYNFAINNGNFEVAIAYNKRL